MKYELNNKKGIAQKIEHLSFVDFQYKEGNNINSVYNKRIE